MSIACALAEALHHSSGTKPSTCDTRADLFTISLRNDDIQEFDSKWDGILLAMTKIPSDDILESLYKLRIPYHTIPYGSVTYYT